MSERSSLEGDLPAIGPTHSIGAQRVQDALCGFGLTTQVVHMPQTTRTALEAARTIGCSVGQIVKSILFKGTASGKPILVLASGSNRVSEGIIAGLVGEPIAKADAAFVRESSGFVIGGVPPLAHRVPPSIFIDRDLFQYEETWAAAGTPFEVFRITPPELKQVTGGEVIRIHDERGARSGSGSLRPSPGRASSHSGWSGGEQDLAESSDRDHHAIRL